MTLSRRRELLAWASQAESWIIEDDYDSEYRFSSSPIPALQGIDNSARVIYIGTLSKVLFPSLRIGYIVIPKDLIPAFRVVKEAEDIFTATVDQAALGHFIRSGDFARHLRRMRKVYGERRRCLADALQAAFEEPGFTVIGEEAGMSLVVLLPDRFDDAEVSRACAERKVSVSALSRCYLGQVRRPGLILGFGGTDRVQIAKGVETLVSVLRSYAPAR